MRRQERRRSGTPAHLNIGLQPTARSVEEEALSRHQVVVKAWALEAHHLAIVALAVAAEHVDGHPGAGLQLAGDAGHGEATSHTQRNVIAVGRGVGRAQPQVQAVIACRLELPGAGDIGPAGNRSRVESSKSEDRHSLQWTGKADLNPLFGCSCAGTRPSITDVDA